MQTAESTSDLVWLVVLGVVLAVVGTMLATNFRGFTERHVRRSIMTTAPLQRVPPWRWLHPPRVRNQVVLARVIGTALALGGVAAFAKGVLNLV